MPAFTLSGPIPGSAQAAAAAGGLQPVTIETGVVVQVGTNIQAQAGAANTPQTPVFCIPPRGDHGDRTLDVMAVGIGAVPTTVTANLLQSDDGGASWQIRSTGLTLVAASAGTSQQVKNLVAGPLYCFALTTLALGGATGVNINASLS